MSLATFFHAIDSRPVWWTGPEARDRSPASPADCDCVSGLVSSLVITVVVSRSTGLGSHSRSVSFDNLYKTRLNPAANVHGWLVRPLSPQDGAASVQGSAWPRRSGLP